MKSNTFELAGKITFIDVKYSQNGNCVTRTLMSKKGYKEGEYDTFPVMFFGKSAEDYAEAVKKGDTVAISGRIAINKYEKDGKTIEKIELIGDEFTKVVYDENARSYVPADGEKCPWED